jgi:ribonuclease HII
MQNIGFVPVTKPVPATLYTASDMGKNNLRINRLLKKEQELWDAGFCFVAGVDEAGRGPLAGPVVAAAVIFPPHKYTIQVDDSKKLTSAKREDLLVIIKKTAAGIGIGSASEKEIDTINIRQATLLAMERAVANLPFSPDYLLVDGRDLPLFPKNAEAIIKGDEKCFSIAAASIVAKVTRDHYMIEMHERYPEYGFDRHKGYSTEAHIRSLKMHGPCPIHRFSFRPIFKEGL